MGLPLDDVARSVSGLGQRLYVHAAFRLGGLLDIPISVNVISLPKFNIESRPFTFTIIAIYNDWCFVAGRS